MFKMQKLKEIEKLAQDIMLAAQDARTTDDPIEAQVLEEDMLPLGKELMAEIKSLYN